MTALMFTPPRTAFPIVESAEKLVGSRPPFFRSDLLEGHSCVAALPPAMVSSVRTHLHWIFCDDAQWNVRGLHRGRGRETGI